ALDIFESAQRAEVIVMSHFACADEPESDAVARRRTSIGAENRRRHEGGPSEDRARRGGGCGQKAAPGKGVVVHESIPSFPDGSVKAGHNGLGTAGIL